jgi:phosphinothricin acetyltransferase
MTDVQIRPATDADMAAVSGIYAHYVLPGTATFEIEPPTADEMRNRRDLILVSGLPYLVAEIDHRVAGFAYAGPYRPRPAYRFTVEDSIYVSPESQGRGLGRLLLSELIAVCEKQGYRQMVAVIGGSDNTGSVRLHAMFGFRTAGVLTAVGLKFGRWIDTVLMQRELGAGAVRAEAR